jgi:hypothetical protein
VALKDGSNKMAVVDYYGDMSDFQSEAWQVWRVRLQDFADANNVDLSNIATVYVGFGDRYNHPTLAGRGTVWFDDFRLYPSRCIEWDAAYGGSGMPDSDINEDCVVDFKDFAIAAAMWVETGMWP